MAAGLVSDRQQHVLAVFYALDILTNARNESDLAPLHGLIRDTAPHLAAGTTASCHSTPSRVTAASTRLHIEHRAGRRHGISGR